MKAQYFNGIKFTQSEENGYFLNSTIRKRMHRYVWEFYNGSIPDGYEVHHKDGDKSNNSIENLEMLDISEHHMLHGRMLTDEERERRRRNVIENAIPKAAEWHKSEDGRKWHREHAKAQIRTKTDLVCICCGKSFQSGRTDAKYCCNACKSKYARDNKLYKTERVCAVCGKAFLSEKYRVRTYCSKSCAMIARHENKKQKEAGN